MKYLDLFTGIGGFTLGIQQAYEILNLGRTPSPSESEDGRHQPVLDDSNGNGRRTDSSIPECIGFSEIDKYAAKVYQHHFPTHHNYGDITKINADELPDFDLLVGGFPCQSFSIAGKRRGFADTRGTLFFDIARILQSKRPRLFLLENVKGLLSHDNGKTFSTIISTLDELGYDLQWQVLNSKNHGVPQNRERIFIIGNLRGTSRPEVFPFGQNDSNVNGESRKKLSSAPIARCITATEHKQHGDGNYIRQLNSPTHSNDRVYGEDGISPTLNTMQGGNRQPFVKIPEATRGGYAIAQKGDSINLAVPNSKTRRGRVGKGIAQTLDTGMQQHTLSSDMRIRRLTPTECERLQGFPDGWTKKGVTGEEHFNTDGYGNVWSEGFDEIDISDSQRYKMCGNAVTVNVIRDIMVKLL